jgi:hypothetical protein
MGFSSYINLYEGHGFSRAVNSCALDGFTGCRKTKLLKGTAFQAVHMMIKHRGL